MTGVTQGANGSVTFTAGGVTYMPAANFFGTDSFTYTVTDDGTNERVLLREVPRRPQWQWQDGTRQR